MFHPRCNRGRRDKQGVGRLFEWPASRGTKLDDRHTLMVAVMRSPLRCDLGYAGVLDAELFAQQRARIVKPVDLRRESHPRIDAIRYPGACVYNGLVGQRNCMEYRRLDAVLPALGKMEPWWLRFGNHRDHGKRVLESFRFKGAISVIDSKCYGPDGEPKDSLDQGTYCQWMRAS